MGGADIGQADGAGVRHVLKGGHVQFGVGLGAVVRLQPHQVAAPAAAAAQAQYGGLVEALARRQVVGAAPVELPIGKAMANVQRVTLKQKTIAHGDHLFAERQVDTVLAQHRNQVAGLPAQVGILDLAGALTAVAEAGSVTVAPGRRAEHGKGAIQRTDTAQGLVGAQTVFDVALPPRGGAGLVAGDGVAALAVECTEHGFHIGVQMAFGIAVQLVRGRTQRSPGQECGQGTAVRAVVHGLASFVMVLAEVPKTCQ
ncbi:hypothetical protein D3C81_952320 [compost metagenome]